jgi:hypothetical protein
MEEGYYFDEESDNLTLREEESIVELKTPSYIAMLANLAAEDATGVV